MITLHKNTPIIKYSIYLTLLGVAATGKGKPVMYFKKKSLTSRTAITPGNITWTEVAGGLYHVSIADDQSMTNVEGELMIMIDASATNYGLANRTFQVLPNDKVHVSGIGSDTQGDGSFEAPYATLKMAYNNSPTGAEIIVMSSGSVLEVATPDATLTLSHRTIRGIGGKPYINGGGAFFLSLGNCRLENVTITTEAAFSVVATTGVVLDKASITGSGTIDLREGEYYDSRLYTAVTDVQGAKFWRCEFEHGVVGTGLMPGVLFSGCRIEGDVDLDSAISKIIFVDNVVKGNVDITSVTAGLYAGNMVSGTETLAGALTKINNEQWATSLTALAIKAVTDQFGFDGGSKVIARVGATDDISLAPTQVAEINAEVDQALIDYDSGNGVAKEVSVNSIQNNTRFVSSIPTHMLIPDVSETMFQYEAYFYNTEGSMEDPDSNELAINAKDIAGTDKIAFFDNAAGSVGSTLSATFVADAYYKMVRLSQGHYRIYYKLVNLETVSQWALNFALKEATVELHYGRSTLVVDENPGSVDLADSNNNKGIVAKALKDQNVSGTGAVTGSVHKDLTTGHDDIDAKTTNLPADPASDTAVSAVNAIVSSNLVNIGFIKNKTDNLPADTAAVLTALGAAVVANLSHADYVDFMKTAVTSRSGEFPITIEIGTGGNKVTKTVVYVPVGSKTKVDTETVA